MDNLTGIFMSSFVIAFSGAVIPGPVLSITISESMKRNFWAGPMIVFGHGLLEIGLIALLVAGFADFMNNTIFLSIIAILGGFYLLWMSFCMLKDIKNTTMKIDEQHNVRGSPVLAGILTSLANPYWIIWWATIGLGYVITSMKIGLIGILIFFIGHILADLSWYSMVSFLFSRGKKSISDRIYRKIIGVCAFMLILFGIIFSVWGIRQLASL
ncbi:MAG: LysE family transporter [Candidatus Marinimicrobia bacterium]|nr:LysE family transporter [Candidatus Neomarinimicrobiota bacterium]